MLFRNMRRFGSRRPARSSRSLGFVGLLSLCGASGELACVRAGSMTTPPETWAAQSDLLLREPQDATEELRVLDAWSKTSSPQSEIARLGRLYDLFDCARFTQSALVREVFWTGLTGDVHVANRGKAATVAALELLLEEAWRVEASYPDLSDKQRRFLADFVALVSIDMFDPEDPETLEIQTDAFRRIASEGARELRDNAHWRIYDHVRAVIQRTVAAPVEARRAIGVHALYVTAADPERWLTPVRDHARPPWPPATKITEPMEMALAMLRSTPAWRDTIAQVAVEDAPLHRRLRDAYPPPRDPALPLPKAAGGIGRPDDDSPLVWVVAGGVALDSGGTPAVYATDSESEPLIMELSARLAKDGRGSLLLGSEARGASADLTAAIRAAVQSGASTLHFAMHEPVADTDRAVVTALPLRVLNAEVMTPGIASLMTSPLEFYLEGAGLSVYVDGIRVREHVAPDAGYAEVFPALRRAFPRVGAVRLRLGDDVMYVQLLELMQALVGGSAPMYRGVGLRVRDAGVESPALDSSDARPERHWTPGDTGWAQVRRRAERSMDGPTSIEQAYPLRVIDQERVAALGGSLSTCLPELSRLPRSELVATLVFDEGHVNRVSVAMDGTRAKGLATFRGCVEATAAATRLRAHRERISIQFRWARAGFSSSR